MSSAMRRQIAFKCVFFLGDRPCMWHKMEGVKCECEYYSVFSESLLIIKLDAVGDVLRTTCLLPSIVDKFPNAGITWVTRPEAAPLLDNNPYVYEVIPYGPDAIAQLNTRHFDKVINLDAGKISSALASMARAEEKIGYTLHQDGYVTATNDAAEEWLCMGIFDDLKKSNTRTYQDVMCSIIDVNFEKSGYSLELTEEEESAGREHLYDLGLNLNNPVIGIHTGGGGRWTRKQWGEESFSSLVTELWKELGDNVQVVLFGGPLEKERNGRLSAELGGAVFDTGCDNSLRHFSALVNCCDVVLSGDTLAMHIALAVDKRVVVLFGPTSSAEIELYGRGKKIYPQMDCLVCYLPTCDVSPHCMEKITVSEVKHAIIEQLNILEI